MPNPLVGQDARGSFTVGNITVSQATASGEVIPRQFYVADIYYRVTGPDGANYDFGHMGRTRITVNPPTVVYDKVRSFPVPGAYRTRPVVVLLSGQEVPQTDRELVVAQMTVGQWTAWAYAADGASATSTRTTTFSDGRASIVETKTRTFNDDGSVDETVTANDGRAPQTTRIAQPITSLTITTT